MKKIGFIGCGNIAGAIIGGAISAGQISADNIYCFDVDTEKTKSLAKLGASPMASAKDVAKECDILFLTVKPQVFPVVIEGIKKEISKDTLIVTPAAGIKISKVKELFGFDAKVIRVMPNTPLMYAAGATAMVRGAGVIDSEFEFCQKLFSSCGVTVEVEEDMMDIVTGISGSAPAFFMRFAREIVLEGVRQGMDIKQTERLVFQTMAGTAKMMLESERSADELIKAVASPNGTTEAGLKTMDKLEFDKTTAKVITAAINRSKELSK